MLSMKIYQVLAALILNFNCMCLGMLNGWPSAMFLLFKSDVTPLNRPMTDSEISLCGSLTCIGALVGSPIVALLLDRLGRKRSAIMLAGITTLAWCLLTFGRHVEIVLTAVLLSGVCASTFIAVPVFVSEISEESIRGTLSSWSLFSNGMGFLISYLFKGMLSFTTGLYIGLSMSSIGLILLMLLKESPMVLLNKGKLSEAKKAMGFYRNNHPESKIVFLELEKIKRILVQDGREAINPEQMRLYPKGLDITSTKRVSAWQFFKKSRSSQRALAITMITIMLSVFQGMIALEIYSKLVFVKVVPPEVLSITWCCMLLSLIAVIFGFIGSNLTDLVGRLPLLMFSCIGGGVFSLALGTQIHLYWGPDWLTIALIYLYCASYTVGSSIVPYLLSVEIFLPNVKSLLTMIIFEWFMVVNFINLFTFNRLVTAIGLGPVYYIYSSVCFLTAIFGFFFLPETKGLAVDAIQLVFAKPKANNYT